MGGLITQENAVLWVQVDGSGTDFQPFASGKKNAAMTGKTIPVVTITPNFGRDRFGRPVALNVTKSAPGDLPSATISIFERSTITFLENQVKKQCPLNFQLRFTDCGVLDNPNVWSKVSYWSEGTLTTYNPGDGPALTFNGENMTASGTISFGRVLFLVRTSLGSFVSGTAENILDIAGIPDEDCNECGTGYPGADNVLVAGVNAVGAATAKVIATSNGGGAWGDVIADPFAADEHVSSVVLLPIDDDTYRVIVGTNVTDVAADAKIAYADFNYGDELTPLAAGIWTVTLVSSSANGDIVTALGWDFYARTYIAVGDAGGTLGAIYLSDTQGEFAADAAIFTSANPINGFTTSPDRDFVWAFGESNMILRERDGNSTFETRVGPSGGGVFHSLEIVDDGTLYAGNGQILYKSVDSAGNVNNWTSLKDFGNNKTVVGIHGESHDSQVLRIVVDDTAAAVGQVWETLDGGASFRQISELTNTGYNAAYFSEIDDNKAVIVGDGGVIQLLSPAD